jgi:U3 small nucleolar RNA-associated protein MPP10
LYSFIQNNQANHFILIVKKVEQVSFSPFTELLTEGFDNDQIWEEIASQNEPFLDYAKTTLKAFNHKRFTTQQEKTVTFSDEEESSSESMDLDQDQDQKMQDLSEENDDDDNDDMEQDLAEEEEEEEEEEDDVEPEVVELKKT